MCLTLGDRIECRTLGSCSGERPCRTPPSLCDLQGGLLRRFPAPCESPASFAGERFSSRLSPFPPPGSISGFHLIACSTQQRSTCKRSRRPSPRSLARRSTTSSSRFAPVLYVPTSETSANC